MHRPYRTHPLAALGLLLPLTAPAPAQMSDFDECGVLVSGPNCVLFEGGGGRYVLSEYEGYAIGDEVRVVGSLDEACITICNEADGCIRGATLYDPAVFPCGTELPNFPGDIVDSACTAASAALVGLAALGLMLSAPRRRQR